MSQYHGEITGSGAALDFFLNKYHLYSSREENHSFSANLRPWLEKENTMRFRLAKAVEDNRNIPVEFTVTAMQIDGESNRTLAKVAYPAGIAAINPTLPFDSDGKRLSQGNSLSFTVGDSSGVLAKPWDETALSIASVQDVYQLYLEIQNAVVDASIERAMKLSKARITFGAKLFDMPRPAYEARILDGFQRAFTQRFRWKTVKNPSQELKLHEFLPSKIVQVYDQKGHSPLRTVADGNGIQFGYAVIISISEEGLVWIM